jgi:hypothetical protein
MEFHEEGLQLEFDRLKPNYVRCSPDWAAWEERCKAESWRLKEIIIWISYHKEWAIYEVSLKEVPSNLKKYRERLYDEASRAIKEGRLKAVHDGVNYHVFPLEILLFFQVKGFRIPIACRHFLDRKKDEAFSQQVSVSVKRKKLKVPGSAGGGKKTRRDCEQMDAFVKVVQGSIDRSPPSSYEELFHRPEVLRARHFFNDIHGRVKEYDDDYLKRIISPFMPFSAKKPGPKKSCKV